MFRKDPIGKAIHEFSENEGELRITVESDLMEDDFIPVSYLFRSYDVMPEIEQVALSRASGKILDVGAGAGPHTAYLRRKGFDVTAIDTSAGAINHLNKIYPNDSNLHTSIEKLAASNEKFDTLLLLMNGIGLAGKKDHLTSFLRMLKGLLSEGGKILCDSTDVRYFYEDEDGGMWVDLNSAYQGDFRFRMHFEDVSSDWFNWVYVDPTVFEDAAKEVGLNFDIIFTEEYSFLAELKVEQ